MPALQHESDLFTTTETLRFLKHCQRQAVQADHAKIASLTFEIAAVVPWAVLAILGAAHPRYFYYDSPKAPATVGLGAAVDCVSSGPLRFEQAQAFVHLWQRRFIYADSVQSPKGRFFCSATFFAKAATEMAEPNADSAHFEPAYVFVPEVQVTTRADGSTVTFNCLMMAATDLDRTTAQIYRQLQQLTAADSKQDSIPHPVNQCVTKGVADFERAVTAALQQVHSGKLHKVVLADVMDVVAPQPVNVGRSLQALRQNHPDCTVFSVGNGRGQSFIGASPERLLSIANGQLTTDALAGSASRSQTPGIDIQLAQTLLNSEKERYEHQVVVEFIVQQLRSLGLNPHYTATPKLLQLRHIQHLHTQISAVLSPQTVPPLDILAKLHPTPAVAGVPRQAACQFIRHHETFDRSLYAAPIGWIDTQGNSEFVVGIRSALINGCQARLYAGAGIVAGSEPAKELAEIKLKLQTLLSALV
ncbi:isochorismate synthase [Leptolyngbya sp. BC1307]|uniref:isochorismate synthase n=1 Tax=Leptolyngbya sp. BC1307 TaxID=2029589 RepID=UPI000EFD52BF|nr:isochorismate synthase [Leptolyngbya sp. BC1307]